MSVESIRKSSFVDGMIIQLVTTGLVQFVRQALGYPAVRTFPRHRKPCPSASQPVAPMVTVVAMVGSHFQMGALSDIPIQFDGHGRYAASMS